MTTSVGEFEAVDAAGSDACQTAPPVPQQLPNRVPGWLRMAMRTASFVAPAVAARVAYRMFVTPLRFPQRTHEPEVFGRATTSSIGNGDERIATYIWGDGPPVLLVHGWSGQAGHMAGFVDPLLAAGYGVVALDLPGHGRSAGRRSSLIHIARAIQEADTAYGPFAGLVAHSFGGPSSTYALVQGLRARRVVYVAPGARFELYWDRFAAGMGVSQAVMQRAMRRAERSLGVRFNEIAPLTLAPTVQAPLLILHGTDDREVPITEGRMLAAAWPGAEFRELVGLGHKGILWDTAAIAQTIEFLAKDG